MIPSAELREILDSIEDLTTTVSLQQTELDDLRHQIEEMKIDIEFLNRQK